VEFTDSACGAATGKYVLFLSSRLAGPSALRDWASALAPGRDLVGICGISSLSDRTISIDPGALWDRSRLLEISRGRGPKLEKLVLSGQKIGIFPEIVLEI
jgi:hypothetical protein